MRFVYLAGLMLGQLLMAQGYIEIKCQPGARIFLDDDFQGLSTAQMGGLILEDISAGPHRLKATKCGFHAQKKKVTVLLQIIVGQRLSVRLKSLNFLIPSGWLSQKLTRTR